MCGFNISHTNIRRIYCDSCRTKRLKIRLNQISPDYYGNECRVCGISLTPKTTTISIAKLGSYICKFCDREKSKIDRLKLKADLFSKLGKKCAKCGFDDIRALQLDHIDGGGHIDRNSHGGNHQMYRYILSLNDQIARQKYQILCANCNWIKRDENKELTRAD